MTKDRDGLPTSRAGYEDTDSAVELPQPEVGAMALHLIAHHLDRIEVIEDTMVIGGITASTKITLRQGGGK